VARDEYQRRAGAELVGTYKAETAHAAIKKAAKDLQLSIEEQHRLGAYRAA